MWPSEVPDPVVRAVPDVTDHVVQTAVAYMSDRAAAGDVTDHVVQTAAAHLTDRDAAADVPERVIGTTVSDVPDHVVHTAVADVSGHVVQTAVADGPSVSSLPCLATAALAMEGMSTAAAPAPSTSVIAAPTARVFILLFLVMFIVSAFPVREVRPAPCGR